mgnify:CR=1 FL=1
MMRWTANIILLVMAGVWAYLSVLGGEMVQVSEQFIYLAAIIAGGDLGAKAIDKSKGGSSGTG